MTDVFGIIFISSIITLVMCIVCYIIKSTNRQLKKYSIKPINEDEYPA